MKTPSGLASTTTTVRTASLADPNDPLTLTALRDTVTVNGKAYKRTYEASARTWTRTTPAGRLSTIETDAKGRPVVNQVPGLAPSTWSYDPRGRLIEMTQGAGAETRTSTIHYYASGPQKGYVQSLTDALGRSTLFDYDLAGRMTRKTLPGGRQVGYEYDGNGNLTALYPPGQPPHLFDYTALDQEAVYTPPDLGRGDPATRYGYNRDKDLLSVIRPDGQRLELTYDSGGRLSTLTAPHGDYTYGYHAATGQLSTLTAPAGGRLSYRYDGFLMTESSWAGDITGSLNRKYNSDFRITELAVNGSPIPFGYDADGLLIQAGALALTRNAGHGLLTGTALGALTDRYHYNGFGEVTDSGAEFNATALFTTAYTRDGLGRIIEKRETEGGTIRTHAYAYDLAGRLAEVKENGAVVSTYTYDANGNRTHVNGVEMAHYDAHDRLVDYQGTTYTYTSNGELASKTEGAFTTTYDYDVLGNLRSVELPDGRHIDYLIDGQSRRIGKKVNGVLVQDLLYQDQLRPIAELDGNNQVVSRFVYADKPNVPAYLVKGGITYRILSDHLGSPRVVVNSTDGSIVQQMNYDEWGRVILDTNPGFQPFGFAGGLYDPDTKLVRFGARDYDAATGRWTAKDPIRF
ncbi:MAG: RHS repeat-associated core domain-containing protein, partial [Gammaproteobacteria bacterium]